jgi:hypothetical protein
MGHTPGVFGKSAQMLDSKELAPHSWEYGVWKSAEGFEKEGVTKSRFAASVRG